MSLLRENVIFDYYVSLVLIEINAKKSKNVLIVEDWFMSLRFSMFMSLLATKSYVLIASTPFKSSKNAICDLQVISRYVNYYVYIFVEEILQKYFVS